MNVKEKLVSSAHSFVREGAGEGQCKSSKGLVSLGGMGNVRFPNSLDTSRGDTRDLLLDVQVHLGWRRHVVIGFVSISCSELTYISAVVDLM